MNSNQLCITHAGQFPGHSPETDIYKWQINLKK